MTVKEYFRILGLCELGVCDDADVMNLDQYMVDCCANSEKTTISDKAAVYAIGEINMFFYNKDINQIMIYSIFRGKVRDMISIDSAEIDVLINAYINKYITQ